MATVLADGSVRIKTKVDIMKNVPNNQGDKMTKTMTHLPEARKTALAAVRRKGEITRDAVLRELRAADQPLVASEVRALLIDKGMVFDPTYVRTILQGFVADGLASTRAESSDERLIRNGGRATRGSHHTAMYYWAPAGKVPFRTKMTTVKPTVTKKRKKKNRPVVKAPVQTGRPAKPMIPTLLERIAQLEKQVAEIQALLG